MSSGVYNCWLLLLRSDFAWAGLTLRSAVPGAVTAPKVVVLSERELALCALLTLSGCNWLSDMLFKRGGASCDCCDGSGGGLFEKSLRL